MCFNRPIVGAIEIIEYALVYITFLGASWAVPRGAHIDIDVAVQTMPPFWQRVCALLSNLISLARRRRAHRVRRHLDLDRLHPRHAFKPTDARDPDLDRADHHPDRLRAAGGRASCARASCAPMRRSAAASWIRRDRRAAYDRIARHRHGMVGSFHCSSSARSAR